jgi:hypothetical protein
MMIKGIVYGSTFESASIKLTEIIDNYVQYFGEDVIEFVAKGKHTYTVEFTNGDTWQARGCSEHCRGLWCHVAYIERSIGRDTIATIIKPTIKGQPWTAYHYFGPPKTGDEELWNIP